jgi:hypothetical protein
MGTVPAEVVMATFYNFEPSLVRRALDGVWAHISPAEVIAARFRAADRSLRRVLGDDVDGAAMVATAATAREVALRCAPAGRPLFAGHAALSWPDAPHLILWHALTLLREYRGDGHVAMLVNFDVAPCEALVLHAATGEVSEEALRVTRSWSDDDWAAAVSSLAARGLVRSTNDGGAVEFTEAGRELRQTIESETDRLALGPWEPLGEEGCAELRQTIRPWSRAIVEGGTFGLDAAEERGT